MSWRGMTFGEFNSMLANLETIPLVPVDEPCVHPFTVLGMQWHARRTPNHVMVTIEYRCPDCGVLVATAVRDVKR